ncbi:MULTISPECIES: DUF2255 family protein [unclassified Isoptericola]|uniref:DUF2255 family protein n=1 Tax=unclassified Isoptericola TaxID=2623355 RepID=UPI0027140937|nr:MULTISPECIES: DUF2255 family protein [unclassified Isoptericola]MDO8147829.1 DUF2255 family protein [Isoptericola sp. b515]MDO8149912.1 DUF2255 family protein [Isoptericola sp. b408]
MTIATTRPETDALPTGGVVHLLGEEVPAPAWLVRVGEETFLRSTTPHAVVDARGRGRVRVGATDRHVVLSEVAPEMHDLLDDAFRATYGRCRPDQVADMVSDDAAASTYRVRGRRPTVAERLGDLVVAWRARTTAPGRGVPGVRRGADTCPCTP